MKLQLMKLCASMALRVSGLCFQFYFEVQLQFFNNEISVWNQITLWGGESRREKNFGRFLLLGKGGKLKRDWVDEGTLEWIWWEQRTAFLMVLLRTIRLTKWLAPYDRYYQIGIDKF